LKEKSKKVARKGREKVRNRAKKGQSIITKKIKEMI